MTGPMPAASQLAQAVALLSGAVPRRHRGRVLSWMTDDRRHVRRTLLQVDGVFDQTRFNAYLAGTQARDWNTHDQSVVASPFGARLVHEALTTAGHHSELLRSLSLWDDFLVHGQDTFGEQWDGGSPVHGWSATPTVDLLTGLCGISPAAGGFVRAQVRPFLGAAAPLQFHGRVPTPRGLLTVRVDHGAVEVDSPVPVDLVLPGITRALDPGRHRFTTPSNEPIHNNRAEQGGNPLTTPHQRG